MSDELLEQFMRKMPTKRDDFLQFPYALRKNVESGQDKYSDEIFEIIEEFEL